jgi:small ligand-binding sensory domain FIST
MISAGVGIAANVDAVAAAERASADALQRAGIERADAALVIASAACGGAIPAAVEAACGALGTRNLAGASAHALMSGGLEVRESPAVLVLAFKGLVAEALLVDDLRGEEGRAGSDIASQLEGELGPDDLVILMPDGHGLLARPLLDGVVKTLAPATIVGFGAAEVSHAAGLSWRGGDVVSRGVSGLVLRPRSSPRLAISPAFRVLGEHLSVSRARGNWLLTLDGRPALEVYREVARGPLAQDLRRAARFLLLAVVRGGTDSLQSLESPDSASLVARNVVGFDEKSGAISLPEPLEPGDRVAFVLRDETAAREQLSSALARLGTQPPGLGLYFGCRGAAFGHDGLEAGYLEGAYPGAPIAGLQGAFQIGPPRLQARGGSEELLSYAGVLALIDS